MDNSKAINFFTDTPLVLLEFGNELKLNQQALQMIRSIDEEIILTTILGTPQSGKSYLMNLIIQENAKGFKVSSQTTRSSKGIYIWGNYKSKDKSKSKMLFIDTEFSSSNNDMSCGPKIFTLLYLISSVLLYNTSSFIDEKSISEFSILPELPNSILTNHTANKEALITELAPKFYWILRDFMLEFVHPESGQPISGKDYFDLCLRKKSSRKENSLIKENIIKFLHNRDLFCFIRPVEDDKLLSKLDTVKFEDLQPNFKDQLSEFKNKILQDSYPKKIYGKKLTGPTLANLLSSFVEAINKGIVPNINTIWDQIVFKDIDEFYKKSLNYYKDKVNNLKSHYELEELIRILYEFRYEAQINYNKCAQMNQDILSNKIYLSWFNSKNRDLEDEFTKIENEIIENNRENNKKYCLNLLNTEYSPVEKKVLSGFYSSSNIDEFVKNQNNLLVNYNQNAVGETKLDVLLEFLTIKHPLAIKSIVKKIGSEIETKSNEINKKIEGIIIQKRGVESENKMLKEKNESLYIEINDLKSQLQKIENEKIESKNEVSELEKIRKDLIKEFNIYQPSNQTINSSSKDNTNDYKN